MKQVFSRAKKLFFPDTFDPVANKRAQKEDEQKDENLDKDAQNALNTDIKTLATGRKVLHGEDEDDPQDEAGNRAIPEEAGIVLLPAVNKAKDNTQDQIQEYQEEECRQHTYSLG